MRLVFTVEARLDLSELRGYLINQSPNGLANVTQHIEGRIKAAMANPNIGRPSPLVGVRELIEPKYGYLIPYALLQNDFYVLRIYHGSRQPLDYSNLVLPFT